MKLFAEYFSEQYVYLDLVDATLFYIIHTFLCLVMKSATAPGIKMAF